MPNSPPAPAPTAAPATGPFPTAAPRWQQWVTPAVLLVAAGLFLTQQNRAFDVLREDLRASEARQHEALRASETRQQEALKAMEARQHEALRASETRQQEALKAMEARWQEALGRLEGKVDRLLESR